MCGELQELSGIYKNFSKLEVPVSSIFTFPLHLDSTGQNSVQVFHPALQGHHSALLWPVPNPAG